METMKSVAERNRMTLLKNGREVFIEYLKSCGWNDEECIEMVRMAKERLRKDEDKNLLNKKIAKLRKQLSEAEEMLESWTSYHEAGEYRDGHIKVWERKVEKIKAELRAIENV